MKLLYTRRALADIDSIYAYLAEQNPLAAVAVLTAIEKTTNHLQPFPESAVATNIRGVRVAMVYPYPFLSETSVMPRDVDRAARDPQPK
ncbi:MAG TPA: type II toxin-antitoxin system RelE/ParE family toxin [Stellaceae bacterium]|jgi:plasmid stabilization system protein ParE|nr:type II toxin-antitoxin system RelE/ParE family toxin [Stellaceae bacterium]